MSRVALVTGAARGIGAATVSRLMADGYRVMALDSCEGAPLATKEDLEELAQRHGDRIICRVVDVRDRTGLTATVAEAVRVWGRLDVAVAAAAVVRGGQPLWETTDEDFDTVWDVDAKGVWNTAAAAVPAMISGPHPKPVASSPSGPSHRATDCSGSPRTTLPSTPSSGS